MEGGSAGKEIRFGAGKARAVIVLAGLAPNTASSLTATGRAGVIAGGGGGKGGARRGMGRIDDGQEEERGPERSDTKRDM